MKSIKMLIEDYRISGIIIPENTLVETDLSTAEDGFVFVNVLDERSIIHGKDILINVDSIKTPYGTEKLKENEYRLKNNEVFGYNSYLKGSIFSLKSSEDGKHRLNLISPNGWHTSSEIVLFDQELETLFDH